MELRVRKTQKDGWYVTDGNKYLWKTDIEFHVSTGYSLPEDPPGYFKTEREAILCKQLYELRQEERSESMISIKGRKVSEETADLALQEYFKTHEAEEFEPVKICHITVSIDDNVVLPPIRIEGECSQTIVAAKRTIAAIQSAIDFVEKKL